MSLVMANHIRMDSEITWNNSQVITSPIFRTPKPWVSATGPRAAEMPPHNMAMITTFNRRIMGTWPGDILYKSTHELFLFAWAFHCHAWLLEETSKHCKWRSCLTSSNLAAFRSFLVLESSSQALGRRTYFRHLQAACRLFICVILAGDPWFSQTVSHYLMLAGLNHTHGPVAGDHLPAELSQSQISSSIVASSSWSSARRCICSVTSWASKRSTKESNVSEGYSSFESHPLKFPFEAPPT